MIANDDFVLVCGWRIIFRGTELEVLEYIVEHPWERDLSDVLTWEEYILNRPAILEDLV